MIKAFSISENIVYKLFWTTETHLKPCLVMFTTSTCFETSYTCTIVVQQNSIIAP